MNPLRVVNWNDEFQESTRAAGTDYQRLGFAIELQKFVAQHVAPRVEHVSIFNAVFAGAVPDVHM
jgi:hypothetical protein